MKKKKVCSRNQETKNVSRHPVLETRFTYNRSIVKQQEAAEDNNTTPINVDLTCLVRGRTVNLE